MFQWQLLYVTLLALLLLSAQPFAVLATLTVTPDGQPSLQVATRAPLYAVKYDDVPPSVEGLLLRGHFQADAEHTCQLVLPIRASRSNATTRADGNRRPVILTLEHLDALEHNCTSLFHIREAVLEYSRLRVNAGHGGVAALVYMPNRAVGGQHIGGPADYPYVRESAALRSTDSTKVLPMAVVGYTDAQQLKRIFFDAVTRPIRASLEHDIGPWNRRLHSTSFHVLRWILVAVIGIALLASLIKLAWLMVRCRALRDIRGLCFGLLAMAVGGLYIAALLVYPFIFVGVMLRAFAGLFINLLVAALVLVWLQDLCSYTKQSPRWAWPGLVAAAILLLVLHSFYISSLAVDNEHLRNGARMGVSVLFVVNQAMALLVVCYLVAAARLKCELPNRTMRQAVLVTGNLAAMTAVLSAVAVMAQNMHAIYAEDDDNVTVSYALLITTLVAEAFCITLLLVAFCARSAHFSRAILTIHHRPTHRHTQDRSLQCQPMPHSLATTGSDSGASSGRRVSSTAIDDSTSIRVAVPVTIVTMNSAAMSTAAIEPAPIVSTSVPTEYSIITTDSCLPAELEDPHRLTVEYHTQRHQQWREYRTSIREEYDGPTMPLPPPQIVLNHRERQRRSTMLTDLSSVPSLPEML